MKDTATISLASSELDWDDVKRDAFNKGFKTVSGYVQYCLEYFHNKKWSNIVKPFELYMIVTLTIQFILVILVLFRG